jgi:hypothetical protein
MFQEPVLRSFMQLSAAPPDDPCLEFSDLGATHVDLTTAV